MALLLNKGKKVALSCSTAFSNLAKAQSRVLGANALHLILIDHPLGGVEEKDLMLRFEQAKPKLNQLLSGFLS